MEGIESDEKRQRLSYGGGPPPISMHRMSHPEQSHSYPAQGPPAPHSWRPPTSPYVSMNDPRGPPEQLAQHVSPQQQQPPPPPQHPSSLHNSYGAPPPREPQYPEPPYGRSGSSSAPTPSPSDAHQHIPFQQMNGAPHEAHQPPGPPGPPPPPQHPNTDYRARPGYGGHDGLPNGNVPNGLPMMPTHSEDMQGPPPPLQHPTSVHYPPHPSAPPPSLAAIPAPYPHDHYYMSMNQQMGAQRSRRPIRAAQACDACRQRKAKCDEGRPQCGHCKENGLVCNYKEVPPAKQEKANQATMEKLDSILDYVRNLETVCQAQKQQMELLEQVNQTLKQHSNLLDHLCRFQAAQSHTPIDHLEKKHEGGLDLRPANDPTSTPPITVPASIPVSAPAKIEHLPSSTNFANDPALEAHDGLHEDSNDSTLKATSEDEAEQPGELSIPVEHITAAHKLLVWPSIARLFKIPKRVDYIMMIATTMGLIRLYGRGRGGVTEINSSTSDSSNAASPQSDAHGSSPGGFPESSWWGTGFQHAKFTDARFIRSSSPSHDFLMEGGLTKDGALNLDSHEIDKLFISYINHMHILHPFLEENRLRVSINSFKKSYSPSHHAAYPSGNGIGDAMRNPTKRKRSSDGLNDFPGFPSAVPGLHTFVERTHPLIERSVDNSLILLVMALGKICSRKTDLPGPTGDKPTKPFAHATASPATGTDSSPALSSISMNSTRSVRSPLSHVMSPSGGFRSNSTGHMFIGEETMRGNDRRFRYNAEVIPGLAYYAQASDILGDFKGSTDLSYVQACLLAGLYMGQLAEFVISHSWIAEACRACLILVSPKKFKGEPSKARQDLVRFAYWTCLQLESDILAELDLPASGISRFEETIRLPRGIHFLPKDIQPPQSDLDIMFYYSAQVSLRKILNKVHTELYKEQQDLYRTSAQEGLSITLEDWKKSLPDWMQWQDGDKPPEDINTARLRAKYYGARYIIFRPILHHALHPNMIEENDNHKATSAVSPHVPAAYGKPAKMHRQNSGMAPPRKPDSTFTNDSLHLKDLTPKVRRACEICVSSARYSTTAFDGVQSTVGRLIVTNIFGTAHAQFGNILVLAATYKSNLSALINRDDLEYLFNRTILFLTAVVKSHLSWPRMQTF